MDADPYVSRNTVKLNCLAIAFLSATAFTRFGLPFNL